MLSGLIQDEVVEYFDTVLDQVSTRLKSVLPSLARMLFCINMNQRVLV
jgi:hypothetical protein